MYQTQPTKLYQPNPTYQTQPIKPNLPNQTYQTKPTQPNLPYPTYQTQPTKHNQGLELTLTLLEVKVLIYETSYVREAIKIKNRENFRSAKIKKSELQIQNSVDMGSLASIL